MLRWARNHSRKDPVKLIDAVFTALGEQTVTVAGTEAVELVIPRVAAQIKELKHQRTIVADEVEKLLDDFPLSRVLMSMPGVGIKTAATILLTIGDASSFTHRRTPRRLRRHRARDPALRHLHPRRIPGPLRQQTTQERALQIRLDRLAATTRRSKAYYDRKRAQGKKHNAAVICLARRRCDVIFAMLKNGTLYQEETPQAA